jgi:hypothetical protein
MYQAAVIFYCVKYLAAIKHATKWRAMAYLRKAAC